MSSLKTKLLIIPKNDTSWGRDAGKAFLLTEMPAAKAEKWALRMFLALKGSESQIPLNVSQLGMVGVAIVGINIFLRSTVKFEELEPLLDEMLTCVQAVPDPKNNPGQVRPLIEGEILEPSTLARLRSLILELHTGFSLADSMSQLISEVMTATASLNTSTSPR